MPEHLGPVADHDQRAHVGLQDAVEAVPQRAGPGAMAPSASIMAARGRSNTEPAYLQDAGSRSGRPVQGLRTPWRRNGDRAAPPTRPARRARSSRRAGRPPVQTPVSALAGVPAEPRSGSAPAPKRGGNPAGRLPSNGAGVCATWRTSPPRPTSPSTTTSSPTGCAGHGRRQRHAHGQIGSRIGDPHPADDRDVHVVGGRGQAGPAIAAPPAATPAGRRRTRSPTGGGSTSEEGTTRAWISTSRGRWPSMDGNTTDPGVPERRSTRNSPPGVGHPLEAAAGHLEQPQLPGRTEAVLDRPQQAQGVVAVALEGQHGVDQVLEQAGAGQGPLLGDMADQDGRGPRRLGHGRQLLGAAPHLDHRARARVQVRVPHGLDGVDHHHVRAGSARTAARMPGRDVSATSHSPGTRASSRCGPAPHLGGRLLGRDQQGPRSAAAGRRRQGLEQQRRLADARARPRAG